MVDDGVNINSDTDVVTSSDHVLELCIIATTTRQLIAYGLVTLPPRAKWVPDHRMLVWRRNLDTAKTVRTKKTVYYKDKYCELKINSLYKDIVSSGDCSFEN